MPRRGLISLIFTIAGLRLIIGYVPPAQAGIGKFSPDPMISPDPSASPTVDPTPTPSATPDPSLAPGASATPKPTPKPTAKPKPTPTPAISLHDGNYSGSNFNYNYGTMKVTITISGGKVSNASVSQSGRWAIGYRMSACTESVFNSAAINLAAGGSTGSDFMNLQPNACSGASYSWWGYANSLQSAIDKATF
jgi:hypothetical protein